MQLGWNNEKNQGSKIRGQKSGVKNQGSKISSHCHSEEKTFTVIFKYKEQIIWFFKTLHKYNRYLYIEERKNSVRIAKKTNKLVFEWAKTK